VRPPSLDDYRRGAERFLADHDREYLLHFAGRKPTYDLEAIHRRHAALFERDAVEAVREAREAATGEDAARLRWLLAFAVEGRIGALTRDLEAEIARREATLVLDVDGAAIPFRGVTAAQMNDPDADRRAALEAARLACNEAHLTPLRAELRERSAAEARSLGWPDEAAMWGDLRALDLGALAAQASAFLDATAQRHAADFDEELRRTTGVPAAAARRSDLPRMMRDADADDSYPAARLVPSLEETLAGLGIALAGQDNVHLDVEARPGKSPRAFCAPVHVPGEVHLVIAPFGGRDDYAALFHEAGHAEHYAHVDPGLPFEFRHLGDNSVTEGFAGLFEQLPEDAAWLGPGADRHVRRGLVRTRYYQRRYAAKLLYELALLGPGAGPADYARRLADATGVAWPPQLWLEDVDPGFYVACYLRAWALADRLREALRGRWGERWFAQREAGEYLRGLWREGQRSDGDELADAIDGGGPLDLTALAAP
jgi:hypothetical protein